MAPFFTIIIPTYNRRSTIQVAINSVLNQPFGQFEIIVVDDGSTDGTKDAIDTVRDARLRYFFQENKGVTNARNTGASLAAAPYLLFLDSDDLLSPNFLERLHDELIRGKCTLAFGYARYIDPSGKEIAFVRPEKANDTFGPPLAGAFAIEKELYNIMGGYDEKLAYSENTEFFLRLKLEHKMSEQSVCLVPDEGVIVNFRNSRDRFNEYNTTKFKSIGYLLKKHEAYFATSTDAFVKYKSIYALGAFKNGDIIEAKRSIKEVLRKNPRRIKTYFQYLLFKVPILARIYWGDTRK